MKLQQNSLGEKLRVYLGNKVERLFDAFHENVYSDRKPFAKRLVMVGTPPIKTWLMLQLAEKGGIAAGLEIATTEEIFRKLLKGRSFPKLGELALSIEMEIHEISSHKQENETWIPLLNYLGSDAKKISPLSFELAQLFQKYNLYGSRWGRLWNSKDWQKNLWDRLFPFPPAHLYQSLEGIDEGTLEIFAVSFLPPIQWDFLKGLSKKIPVRAYCLSPCENFWSDLVSEKEAIFQKRGSLFTDVQQPLLANFGKIGRVTAKWIEENEVETVELYEETLPSTLLEHLQNDLRTLRDFRETPPTILESDHSLQIHGAPTLIREVEVVQQLLLKLVEEQGLEPLDILVMAPDISVYAPFIPSVFDGEYFTPHVSDLRLPALEPLIQTFFHLLEFARGRWSSKEFLNLIKTPFFSKKLKWEKQDVEVIQEWIEQCGILWGEDPQHCQNLLKKTYGENHQSLSHYPGTWEFGFKRLLAGLIQTSHDQVAPYFQIESTQGELLGELIDLFHSLKKDLKPLIENFEKPLSEWSDILHGLMDTYFYVKGYEEQADALFKWISLLRRVGEKYSSIKVPFSTVQSHLEKALHQSFTSYKESNLQTVRFCSLLPLRTVPAKVFVLMGMEEGSYPRIDIPLSFDLLHHNPLSDFCPSTGDLDRFIFLEALLSTRKTLLITYQCQNGEDFKPQGPSVLVEELLSAISQGYQTKIPHIIHPLNRFDPQYFKKESPIRSYMKSDFEAANAFLAQKKVHRFIPEFPLPTKQEQPEESLPFEKLVGFIKDPFKAFFHQKLGIYIDDKQRNEEETFIHSPLTFSSLQRGITQQPFQQLLKNAEKEGYLPVDNFRHATEERLKETLKALKHFDISLEDIKEVKFEVPLSVRIVGKLSLVTSEGLLVNKKLSHKNAVEVWAPFLIYLYLKKGKPRLLFLKDRKVFEGDHIEPKEELEKLLGYFYAAKENGSPLHPALVKQFIHGEESLSHTDYSTYMAWLQRGMDLPLAKGWSNQAEELFGRIDV